MADEPTPEQQAALEQLLAGPGVVELTGATTDAPAYRLLPCVRIGQSIVHLAPVDEHGELGPVICGRWPLDTPLEPRPEQLGPRPPGLWCPDCSSYLQYVRALQGLQ